MDELKVAWEAIRYGGPMVYPLLALGVLSLVIIFDRGFAYYRCLRMPGELLELVKTYGFSWNELDKLLGSLSSHNAYGRFFSVIADNRSKPAWWVESRAEDEPGAIEKVLNRGRWVL